LKNTVGGGGFDSRCRQTINSLRRRVRWVLKAKGKSFYVDHIDAEIGWTTRELDTGSTPGMIRFKKCVLAINGDRLAVLRAIPTS
jgi:hypothetical protein